ncbi:MAG TPA: DUF2911 domain-containing protein [Blastocatellia bacterium]|nr:DUF2911 domain-containing protein [Blastocatellia bacterium]
MKKMLSVVPMVFLCWTIACANGSAPATNTGGSPTSPAQGDADRGEAKLTLNGANVTVEYGRPSLRGRDVLSLISPGDEWRMGMNEATTLTTDADLKFGNTVVPRGKYILTARLVEAGKWQLRVKKEDQSVVAEAPLTLQKVDKSAEQMTIELKENGGKGVFTLHWGNNTLSTDFQRA